MLDFGMRYVLASWLAVVAALAVAAAVWLSPRTLTHSRPPALPTPDHVVVTIMENHSFAQIIESRDAPFLRGLARRGALFMRSFGLIHPSQPNYLALFSGSTQDVTDDRDHILHGPTLVDALERRGKTFIGYVEEGSPRKHNPWQSFPRSRGVDRRLNDFPDDFTRLPTVSFVIPNPQDDMHDGTVGQGDLWLHDHLGRYAEWCRHHNALFIVTFDEDNDHAKNRIATLFVGESVVPGRYYRRIDHYSVLSTLLAMYDLPPLGQSEFASPIAGIWRRK